MKQYRILLIKKLTNVQKLSNIKIGGMLMWVLTVYANENKISMYEFNTEKEAREALKVFKGCKILSEVVYYNDHIPHL